MIEKSSKNDPELNEILGSIRRIISEDNAQPAVVDAAPELSEDDGEILDLTEEVTVDVADDDRREPSIGLAADVASEPEIHDEPVLDPYGSEPPVAEVVMEETGVVMEDAASAAADEQPTSAPLEFPASAALELPALDQEVPDREVMAEPLEEPEPIPLEMIHEPEMSVEREPESPVEPEPAFQPAQAFGAEPIRKIVSETATTAAATALGELTRAMDEKTNKLKVGPGDTTVSDMVKEMLRPMLREWLDENLPGIVERIVRREIEKLVDRAEPDD